MSVPDEGSPLRTSWVPLVLLGTCSIPQTQPHLDGRSFSNSLLGGVTAAAKSTNPQDILGFQTDKPREASLNMGTIGDAALAESRSNQAAQHIQTQAQDRQSFKIDPITDPLFKEASQVVANPQRALNEEIKEIASTGSASEETKTCEEGGDEYQQTCKKHLDIVLTITPEFLKPVSCCPGHTREEWQWHGFNSGYITKTDYCGGCSTTYVKVDKDVKVFSEKWVDGCKALEDLAEQGLCRYESKATSLLNETKIIQGEPITRDHFEENYTYACFKKASSNSCVGLREQGCFQIKSVCKENIAGKCVVWLQTYSCPSRKSTAKSYQASNKENPFCLTGNCADTSYEANGELLTVMSQLSALREAQNDLRNFNAIFKGQHRWCTRNCLDFRDCCGGGKGWGVSLHLSSCDAQEVELSTLRDKNLCIQVGTYCAEKHLKVCTRKKTSFCCFGTKMARLIQQNGRAQLGMGFGDSKSPNCNGLSAEQLSRIDFSKIDFSEIFEDIKKQTVSKTQGQSLAQVSSKRLQDNMTLLTKPSTTPKSTEELQKLKEKGL